MKTSAIDQMIVPSIAIGIAMLILTSPVLAYNGDLELLLSQPKPFQFMGGQSVVVKGELEVLQGDGVAATESFIRYFVRSFGDHRLYELGFDGPPSPHMLTGHNVLVRGRSMGSVIWAKDVALLTDAQGTVQADAAPQAITVNERKAITILVNLTDATLCQEPSTCTYNTNYVADKLYTGAHSMSALYLNTSYGQLRFKDDSDGDSRPDVVGPYNIGLSRAGCSYYSWATAADSAAQAAGVNLSLYQHKIYVLPPYSQLPDCKWAGVANVGCSTVCRSWIAEPQSMMVYAHELGHNLNLAHAGTDPENDGVINVEYGDHSDPMGSSREVHNLNGSHIHQLGWYNAFPNSVQSVTTPGTFKISQIGITPDGTLPQVLRIRKPDSGDYYYLTYRQPTDFDVSLSSAYTVGINIHRFIGSSYNYTTHINALSDGEMFTDSVNGITVTQTAHMAGTATVNVSFACMGQTPSVNITPSTVWVKPGAAASLILQMTNRDGAGCAATTYQLVPSNTLGATSILPYTSMRLEAGQTSSTLLSVSGISGSGSVIIEAIDSDNVDPSHPISGHGTAIVYVDGSSPNPPTNFSASLVNQGVKLTWTAASDNGGSGITAYYVYRNGTKIGATSSLFLTDTEAANSTTYSYTVTAIDGVGYESGNSNTASITTKGTGGNKRK